MRYFAAALAAWPPQQPLCLSSVRLAGRGVLKGSQLVLVVRCRNTGASAAEKVAVAAIGKEEAPLATPCRLEGDVKFELHRVSNAPCCMQVQWPHEYGRVPPCLSAGMLHRAVHAVSAYDCANRQVSWISGRRSRALYSAWLHTGFLQPGEIVLHRSELDKARLQALYCL